MNLRLAKHRRTAMQIADSISFGAGELAGLVLRYEAALRLIATHGNMAAAIAKHALEDEQENQHEKQNARSSERADVPVPGAGYTEDRHDEDDDEKHGQDPSQ